MTAIDGALRLWFAMTAVSVLFVAYDVITRTPAMTVMKWGWTLVVAYTGPVGLFVYLLSCREPLHGTHPAYVAPLWKQSVGSTIHCVAGDATGIIAGSLIASSLQLSGRADLALEYAAGFTFGLLIFQALFAKMMSGGGYGQAVRRTLFPEWLSMNALMAGMIPVMSVLMSRDPMAMDIRGLRYWGAISVAVMVGSLTAYPANVWLVATGRKHGMGTAQVLGRGGHRVEVEAAASAPGMPMPAMASARTGRAQVVAVAAKRAVTEADTRAAVSSRRASRAEVVAVGAAGVAALVAGIAAGARFGMFVR